MPRQHVISRWLLAQFAGDGPGGRVLATYHKPTATFGNESPGRFMAPTDDHAQEIEDEIGAVENYAAPAVRGLVERARARPAGLIPLHTSPDAPPEGAGTIRPSGALEDMLLHEVDTWLEAPTPSDKQAIAEFVALMFTRCPKVERSVIDMGNIFRREYVAALSNVGYEPQQAASEIDAAVDSTRWRWLSRVAELGDTLKLMDWWVVRSGPNDLFTLGDAPVAATVSLGHPDDFRPMLSQDSYVVVLPMSPDVALLATRLGIIPVSGTMERLIDHINALTWTWADEYVVAPTRADLETVISRLEPSDVARTVGVSIDRDRVKAAAIGGACKVAVLHGSRWRDCRYVG